MSRLIDADVLSDQMYHEAFETDTEMQRWDSGCWIRYKMFENALRNAPTIEERKTGRWIPVTERLPEDDTVVLVCGKNGGVYTAIHNNSKTWIRGWWKMNSKNHYCNPTAWMPLPEPYKENKDEKD